MQFSNLHYVPVNPEFLNNGKRFKIRCAAQPLVVVGLVADDSSRYLFQPFAMERGPVAGSGWHPWWQHDPSLAVSPLRAGDYSITFSIAGGPGSCLVILANGETEPAVEFLAV